VGTTVQFHIRDADTSTEDLKTLLRPYQSNKPAGVLLFNCNGRGTRLYTEPNQDSSTIQTMLHHPPMSGFFCAGELGPVGQKNFIHGHTASLAIFNG
ncbi:hypothetical protein GF373_13165, partial [bacterium]|nr:hypothetical protein [bacterium]